MWSSRIRRIFGRSRVSGFDPPRKAPWLAEEAHQVWMGDGKHFIVYPVRSGQLLNYVGFVPTRNETLELWSAVGDREELAASFKGWDPRIVRLLETVETCYWWGLYDRRPLQSWTKGRLVLSGDAAPDAPASRPRGNQAIEDGVALAVFLRDRTRPKCPPRCLNTKNCGGSNRLYSGRGAKNGLRFGPNTRASNNAIAKSRILRLSASRSTTTISKTPPSPVGAKDEVLNNGGYKHEYPTSLCRGLCDTGKTSASAQCRLCGRKMHPRLWSPSRA